MSGFDMPNNIFEQLFLEKLLTGEELSMTHHRSEEPVGYQAQVEDGLILSVQFWHDGVTSAIIGRDGKTNEEWPNQVLHAINNLVLENIGEDPYGEEE